MKKLLILMFAAIMTAGCEQPGQDTANPPGKAATNAGITLNNFSKEDADKMMSHFMANRDKDSDPVAASFWISKDMLKNMVDLLEKELAAQRQASSSATDTTDGIRIYFASNPLITTTPLNNEILLISTKDNGEYGVESCNVPEKRRHLDYYDHDIQAALFHMRHYEIPSYGNSTPGAYLYDIDGTQSFIKSCGGANDITLNKAKNMVSNFSKPHTIKTNGAWFPLSFWRSLNKIASKNADFNGIRIYFAKYATDEYCKDRADMDTFVLTTTKRDPKTGLTIDYFECDEKIFGDAKNNGSLCPINCN